MHLETSHVHLQVEDGRPLWMVESSRPVDEREQGGDGGEGGDRLQGVVPAVVGGQPVQQQGGAGDRDAHGGGDEALCEWAALPEVLSQHCAGGRVEESETRSKEEAEGDDHLVLLHREGGKEPAKAGEEASDGGRQSRVELAHQGGRQGRQ